MSKLSRDKGKRWERDVTNQLKKSLGDHVKRTGWMQVGAEMPDVHAAPFFIECKVGKQPRLMAALQQAKDGLERHQNLGNHDNFNYPIVIAKFDRQDPVVLMPLSVFEEIMQK